MAETLRGRPRGLPHDFHFASLEVAFLLEGDYHALPAPDIRLFPETEQLSEFDVHAVEVADVPCDLIDRHIGVEQKVSGFMQLKCLFGKCGFDLAEIISLV